MNDALLYGAGAVLALLAFVVVYSFGFARGLRNGFKSGLHWARTFERMKKQEARQARYEYPAPRL